MVAAVSLVACFGPRVPGVWEQLDTGTGDVFYTVNFVDENNGWLNGQTDRDYVPPEEGQEGAEKKEEPKKPGEKTEDPLKANQGFEVLQTTDGGKTWRQIPDQFKHRIRSVWFVDTQNGWALTIDRDILRTTDGGLSWSVQRKAGKIRIKLIGNRRDPEIEEPEQIDRVHFIDMNHGWAWGGGRRDDYTEQPGILLATTDGGQNWNSVPYPFEADVWSIFFLDADHAWASTRDGKFHHSDDGGINWSAINAKLPEDVFVSIFFIDRDLGWVVGRSGRLARTEDGGRAWRKMYEIKDRYKMRDIHFVDRNRGWAVGEGGAVLYTPDGGKSWVDASAPLPAALSDVFFLDDRLGWAVGLKGAVFRLVPK